MEAKLNRIMVVEDDPDVRTVVSLSLSRIGGYTVQMCGSAREALEAAPSFAPDLVILDVMMPGTDGPSTLKALRGIPATAATPVIFMTARAHPREMARYKELGCLDVITKPFDPATLAEAIAGIWRRAS
jgi:CheY-like chemotaxis protein